MQVSQHFDARELVPKHIWDTFGKDSTWFIDPRIIHVLEFYKSFWLRYYKKKLGNENVSKVLIRVNNWHTGGSFEWRGIRTDQCTQGAKYSQHRFKGGVDCEIIIVSPNGKVSEADYNEVNKVILENEREFMANGVTCVEDPSIATGWLHTDIRWIPDQEHILVVGT